MTTQAQAVEKAGLFHRSLKSLYEFDQVKVLSVITTLLLTTDEDYCFVGTYYRARGNVQTLLEFTKPKHFQAVAMSARALLELAVDIRLLDKIPQGPQKMIAFVEVEKLRCARKAVAFKLANPDANVDPIFDSFIYTDADRIDANRQAFWPDKKPSAIKHWSGLSLDKQVKLLKAPFERMYELDYPKLSWYTHSGLTGVVNLPAEAFTTICTIGFKIAADAYEEILSAMIRKFKLEKADETIYQEMKLALTLPFDSAPDGTVRSLGAV